MKYSVVILLTVALSLPAMAESVADPQDQCPILIAQVEGRLEASPPQDQESVEKARKLLEESREAQEEQDYKRCMSKIREAFKFLNLT